MPSPRNCPLVKPLPYHPSDIDFIILPMLLALVRFFRQGCIAPILEVFKFDLVASIRSSGFALRDREVITAPMHIHGRWIDEEPSAATNVTLVECDVDSVAKATDEEGWYGAWRGDSGDSQANGDAFGVSVGECEEGLEMGFILGW